MDAARFTSLHALSSACIVVERNQEVLGFVLAMRNGAAYDNANFSWFSDRLNRFVYVDRIVLGDQARGLGLGKRLYDQLAEHAQCHGSLIMAAEIDQYPPNAGSMAFHKAYGFIEIGTRTLDSGKIVSMQIKPLP